MIPLRYRRTRNARRRLRPALAHNRLHHAAEVLEDRTLLTVVINEVLFDPATDISGDANGDGTRNASQDEFIEIVNDSANPVDISGWTLSDNDGGPFTFAGAAGSMTTVLQAGEAAVLFGGGTPTGAFGGAQVFTDDGTIGSGLSNGGDLVELRDAVGMLIDSVGYGSAGSVTGGSDQSVTRDPDITGSFVDHTGATGSGGALFSPGTMINGDPFSNAPPEPAVSIVQSGGSTDVTEDGATDSYDISLDTTPTGPVEITVTADAQTQVSSDGGTTFGTTAVLTFTDTTAQTVTVQAIDDTDDEGNHTGTITQAITSTGDPDYPTTLAIPDVAANITDNDGAPPATGILINEVDANTPGSDTLEFIELFDGGAGNTVLDGLVVVLFNGNDDASYEAFDLDGFTTDGNGFFVLGNAAVPNVGLVIPNNLIQNGADAVALFAGNATDFPNDTPVTTTNLVDAVVYDTGDADDEGLVDVLTPEQPQIDEDANGDDDNESIARVPDGGFGRVTNTFQTQAPTPGATNVIANVVQIIDNGDAGFSTIDGSRPDVNDDWLVSSAGTTEVVEGRDGDVHYTGLGDGSAIARWEFAGLAAGTYRVSASWSIHPNRATNAPFSVRETVGGEALATRLVNQENAPDDITDDGTDFEDIGIVCIAGDTLVVELNNGANEYVIADAIRIEQTAAAPGLVRVIDDNNSDSGGYSDTAGFLQTPIGEGRENDIQYASSGNGSEVATWTFTGLTAGTYQVAATWSIHPNRATDAPFTVLDGTGGPVLTTADLNQEVAPDDLTDPDGDGTNYENIGTVIITGDTLVVQLSNDANQFVIADAIRIEELPPAPSVQAAQAPALASSNAGASTAWYALPENRRLDRDELF